MKTRLLVANLALVLAIILPSLKASAAEPIALSRIDGYFVGELLGPDGAYHPPLGDQNGNLQVNCVTGCSGGGGSNAASGATGGSVPSNASYTGFMQSGNLVGVSASAPLPVSGSVSVSNLPATQAVSAASLPLPSGAATASGVSQVNTTLGSPFQAGGTIGNTGFADTTLASILANSKVPVTTYARGPATYTQTSVSVSASTSTQLIAANATRRKLDIIPSNSTCTVNDAGGTASATSKPVPSGWSYTEQDPPPAGAVTAYCTTAAIFSVTEGN